MKNLSEKYVAHTEVMQDLLGRMITSYAEFANHSIKDVYHHTNSYGFVCIVISLLNGDWAILQPISGDDIDIELVDEYTFEHYFFYVLSQAGVCTIEEYEAERDASMKGYYENQENVERKNALTTLRKFPDLIESIRNGELP